MKDTPPSIAAQYRRLLLARSGEERLTMACRMFDAARVLVRASLGDPDGTDDSAEMRARVFLRTYGSDYDAAARARIVDRLRRAGTPASPGAQRRDRPPN